MRRCVRDGVRKGLRTALWLLRLMVPVSFAVAALKWLGALEWLAKWVAPAFRLIGLPGEAAVPFVTGALLSVYSAIAAMGPIALTDRQITLLALMVLIAHNLPVESAVQSKAGSSGFRMVVLRLGAAFAAAAVLNLVIPASAEAGRAAEGAATDTPALSEALAVWAVGAAWLIGKVCLFVMGVMVLQLLLEEFGLMALMDRGLAPVLVLIGLPRRTVFLWIVANTLGLAYGAAVIVEKARGGGLNRRETAALNVSVAVCHSLLEDTLLFVAVGAWPLWIIAPRVAAAALAVWTCRIWWRLRQAAPHENEKAGPVDTGPASRNAE